MATVWLASSSYQFKVQSCLTTLSRCVLRNSGKIVNHIVVVRNQSYKNKTNETACDLYSIVICYIIKVRNCCINRYDDVHYCKHTCITKRKITKTKADGNTTQKIYECIKEPGMHCYYHTIQIKYDNKYTALPNDIYLNITHWGTHLMILYHIKINKLSNSGDE